MLMTLSIDEVTRQRLEKIAQETGRAMDELATVAIAEAALDFYRQKNMKGDPAQKNT